MQVYMYIHLASRKVSHYTIFVINFDVGQVVTLTPNHTVQLILLAEYADDNRIVCLRRG